jgi:uncharacterized protein YggE
MRLIPFLVLAVLSAAIPGRALAQLADLGSATRTISTTGEALVQVVPDHVVVGVGVETFRPTLAPARQANEADCARLLAAIKSLGVAEADIQTDVLNVELAYRDAGHPSRGIEGYYVRRAYSVTVRDVQKFEAVVAAALDNGANRLMGFEFKTRDLRPHRDRARALAIKAAEEKAQALSQAVGLKLGKTRGIAEGSFGYWGASRSWWGWGGYGQGQSQNVQVASGGEGETGGETLPLGRIGVRASVSVTFELEP